MSRSKPKPSSGRYLVGDGEDEKAAPELGCALAYAATLAYRHRRTVYVRIIGQQQAAGRAEWDGHGVTVRTTAGSVPNQG